MYVRMPPIRDCVVNSEQVEHIWIDIQVWACGVTHGTLKHAWLVWCDSSQVFLKACVNERIVALCKKKRVIMGARTNVAFLLSSTKCSTHCSASPSQDLCYTSPSRPPQASLLFMHISRLFQNPFTVAQAFPAKLDWLTQSCQCGVI